MQGSQYLTVTDIISQKFLTKSNAFSYPLLAHLLVPAYLLFLMRLCKVLLVSVLLLENLYNFILRDIFCDIR